ncbi:MAG TPA: 3-isopropylmalate dehydratase small subunit [archaeon]|nr:3-isopropylmalate dehydratase small subunit [archaeon]
MRQLTGRAWKFGDGISTDHITPGRFFHLRSNLPELAKHCLEDERPEFIRQLERGDFIVAGRNFGQGSSREHAPSIIKLSGVGAVIAKSFARIFFRNCANVGLLAVICPTDGIDDGDRLIINPVAGKLEDVTKGLELRFESLPEVMRRILDAGGLVPYVMAHGGLELS